MKNKQAIGFLAAACLGFGANAGMIFQDNFDSKVGGMKAHALSYKGYINWMVLADTENLVTKGGRGIKCVGASGKCIDVNGSKRKTGKHKSNSLFLAAGSYTPSFDILGNQRHDLDSMDMSHVRFISESFKLKPTDTWKSITPDFLVTTVSDDKKGVMLDNVLLSSSASTSAIKGVDVTEPESIALLSLGLLGLGIARRRQRV